MTPRLCCSFNIVIAALLLSSCRRVGTAHNAGADQAEVLAVPDKGMYTGAFIDFGEEEDEVSTEAIEAFEDLVGKHQAIIASSSYWGDQNFPTENLNLIWRHGSMPLVFWSPWDKPYEQHRGPDRFSLDAILAGKCDAYIDAWADGARAFGHPLIVVFANEMNGDWFPWSGAYYGGAKWNEQLKDWEGPHRFKAAYRYVVDRVRARGARNIQWCFHTNNYSYPMDTWNFAPAYYPGKDYVDWLGLSIYGQQFTDEAWADATSLIEWPYKEISQLDPGKPIMIAEWGVGEFPDSGNKALWITEAFDFLQTRCPRVKAAVYWHERWQNTDDSYSNLRVNSSVESLQAYRRGVAQPDWLDHPIFRPQR